MKTAETAEPTVTHALTPERTACSHCGRLMWAEYATRRTVHTLVGVTRLNLTVRRCRTAACAGYKKPYRPEAEGAFALPRHEFGLDAIALIGRLRYAWLIRDGGGHYLLAVKGNQPNLHEAVRAVFEAADATGFEGARFDAHASAEDGHGRHEERMTTVANWSPGIFTGDSECGWDVMLPGGRERDQFSVADGPRNSSRLWSRLQRKAMKTSRRR